MRLEDGAALENTVLCHFRHIAYLNQYKSYFLQNFREEKIGEKIVYQQ